MLDDTYALCIARKQPLSVLLSLMEVYRSETDYTVLMCLTDVSGFSPFYYGLLMLVVFFCESSMMLCFIMSIMQFSGSLPNNTGQIGISIYYAGFVQNPESNW